MATMATRFIASRRGFEIFSGNRQRMALVQGQRMVTCSVNGQNLCKEFLSSGAGIGRRRYWSLHDSGDRSLACLKGWNLKRSSSWAAYQAGRRYDRQNVRMFSSWWKIDDEKEKIATKSSSDVDKDYEVKRELSSTGLSEPLKRVSDKVDSEATQEMSEVSSDESISAESGTSAPIVPIQGPPKPPHVLALPLDRRPIFPGLLHPIQITDRKVYEALLRAKEKGNQYIGLFLRRHDVKARDVIEASPSDRILAINEVHSVGTFVQIMQMDPLNDPEIDNGDSMKGDDESFMSVEEFEGKGHDNDSGEGMIRESKSHRLSRLFGSSRSNSGRLKSKAEKMLANSKDESWTMLVKAHRRIQIEEMVDMGPPPLVRVHHIVEFPLNNHDMATVRAYTNEVINTLRDVIMHNSLLREHMQFFSARFDMSEPYHVCNFAASLTSAEGSELQEVLESFNIEKRLKKVLTLLKKEVQLNALQEQISKQVEDTISTNQRKYFLNEQLKQIKKELGIEHDDKDAILKKYEDRINEINGIVDEDSDDTDVEQEERIETESESATPKKKFIAGKLPPEAHKVITEEMKKLSTLEKVSPEFNVTRAYLDWLLALPWGKCTVENLDVPKASKILEADHFGLSDIKERILEFIAVGKLRGTVKGKIILLVGPPGVGKTSIGKSIAHALDREFYRFSVGGLSDVSEIKGHRRTYIGSMPGKVIQSLKSVGVSNSVILIDEIDKLGSGYRGDPASALLELLDPAQNVAFLDHYLDVPVDLSKVLFVCTANSTDSIPGPLLDRMEVMRLSGYDLPEKVEIAKQYLVPRARKECGLELQSQSDSVRELNQGADLPPIPKSLELKETAISSLARWYCREAGVRKLEQHLERIFRKASLKLLQTDPSSIESTDWSIDETNLEEYVGKPRFLSDKLFESIPPPGVVMGLAWSSVGGSALYIETMCIPHSKSQKKKKATEDESKTKTQNFTGFSVHTTGQLGDVMKESTSLALTNAKRMLYAIDPTNTFFEENQIHLHVPEGATPKDGPSAGITMTTALLGLALGKSVIPDLAMTGEVSLTGMVLPVGGIKEKVIAARRSGVSTIILPDGCRKDVDELPDYLKDNLTIHFVKEYDEVRKIAFGEKN